MVRAFITGITGQDGSYLAAHLLELLEGPIVRAVHIIHLGITNAAHAVHRHDPKEWPLLSRNDERHA